MPDKTVFERHARLTLAVALTVSVGVGVVLVESLSLFPADPMLSTSSGAGGALYRRVIRLKEHLPGYRLDVVPSETNMAQSDNLERRPYRFEVDEDGFIVPSRVHEQAALTVAFLGGSTTECEFMDPEFRYPYVAGRLLEKELGVTVNSLNGGVSGNHTMHANLIFQAKVLPLKPQIAVLMEAVNDVGTMQLLGSYWNDSETRSLIIREESGAWRAAARAFKSALYTTVPNTYRLLKGGLDQIQGLMWRLRHGAAASPPPADDEFAAQRGQKIERDLIRALADYRSSLKSFVGVARAWNIQPVLMTQPTRITETPDAAIAAAVRHLENNGITYANLYNHLTLFNQAIREVAIEEKVPLIDLRAQMPATSRMMYDGMHYTPEGSRFVAEQVAAALVPLVRGSVIVPGAAGRRP